MHVDVHASLLVRAKKVIFNFIKDVSWKLWNVLGKVTSKDLSPQGKRNRKREEKENFCLYKKNCFSFYYFIIYYCLGRFFQRLTQKFTNFIFPPSTTLCPSAFLSSPFVILNQAAQGGNTFFHHLKRTFLKNVSVSM